MPGKSIRILLPLALAAGIAASACGTVATPEWAAEALATRTVQAATDAHLTAIAPTATPPPTATPVPPTATLLPTATPVPPTASPEPPTLTPEPATPIPATAASASGNAANGQVLFNTPHETSSGIWSCAQCHLITPDEARLIGPGLWNVSQRAGSRVPGTSAYDYIHTSIVDPNTFLAPGDPPYPSGLMPQNFEDVLTEQEIDDIIAYLMTLHD